MDGIDLLLIIARVVMVFAMLMVVTILLVWFERKIVADMQNRVGPDRAGPWGILQTLADGMKLFFKEQITPRKVELGLYLAAPMLAVIPAFMMFMVIPFGRPFTLTIDNIPREIPLQGADLNVGLLYILAISSVAVYALVLAGWSSGSKYPLLGGVRATAQAISYEAAMGLSLVPVVLYAGSTRLSEIVAAQAAPLTVLGRDLPLSTWNVLVLSPSFIIFFIAAVAETNRAPFDLVEAEQEIVGGFHTEYSGLRFALFFLAEYINVFTMSALAVTLFFGGWAGPTFEGIGACARQRIVADRVVPGESDRLFVHLRLVACVVAEVALRPADVTRVETAHSGCVGLAVLHRGRPGLPRVRRIPLELMMGPIEAFAKGMAVTWRQFVATMFGKGLVTTKYPEEMREKPQRFTVATCSTDTKTAWRSASAVSCAQGPVPPGASTFAAQTTPRTSRSARASGSASCTRSTCCAASSAACASRPVRPRQSHTRSSSRCPLPTGPTASIPRQSSWSTGRHSQSHVRLGQVRRSHRAGEGRWLDAGHLTSGPGGVRGGGRLDRFGGCRRAARGTGTDIDRRRRWFGGR